MAQKEDSSEIHSLVKILEEGVKTCKIAKRNSKSINGDNYYGRRFAELHSKATIAGRAIERKIESLGNGRLEVTWAQINESIEAIFNPLTKAGERPALLKRVKFHLEADLRPSFDGKEKHAPSDDLFPRELISGTRDYLERISNQASGAYDQGWFDASAVMIRRLLETLIIECFESHGLASKIKGGNGSFLYLKDLVSCLLAEGSWNIGRSVRTALPKLKDIGDQSAHSRRFTARKADIDGVKKELRDTVEELVHLSGLKRGSKSSAH